MKADARVLAETLARLLSCGCTARESLELIASGKRGPIARDARSILDRLKRGESLADAFIASGVMGEARWRGTLLCVEETGNVKPALDLYLASERERDELASAIAQASLNPALTLAVALGALVFLYARGIPAILDAAIATDASVIAGMNRGVIVAALVAVIAAASIASLTVIALSRKSQKNAFWATLDILTAAEIPFDAALELCERVARCPYAITEGDYFFESPGLDSYTRTTFLSARLTGDFRGAIGAIAAFHRRELASLYSGLERTLEPACVLVAGIVLLILSVTVFLPLFNIFGGIQ